MLLLLSSLLLGSPIVPKNTGDESYSETFTTFADLDDGTYVLLQFLFSNAGLGSNKAACRVLVVPDGAEGSNRSVQLSASEWSAQDKLLSVGTCALQQHASTTVMSAEVDNVKAQITFSATLAPKKLPDARIEPKKNEFYEQDILIMSAPVQATWSIGGASHSSAGFAQLDHTRSNTILPQVAKGWYRFRGFRGATSVFAQVRIDTKGAYHGWVYDSKSSSAQPVSKARLGMESFVDTSSQSLFFTPASIVFEYKPLEAYGFVGQIAKAWVGNPVTRTYKGVGQFQGAEVSGILEIVEIEE